MTFDRKKRASVLRCWNLAYTRRGYNHEVEQIPLDTTETSDVQLRVQQGETAPGVPLKAAACSFAAFPACSDRTAWDRWLLTRRWWKRDPRGRGGSTLSAALFFLNASAFLRVSQGTEGTRNLSVRLLRTTWKENRPKVFVYTEPASGRSRGG